MNPERWQRIEALLDVVMDLPPAEREAFLRRECADAPELPGEVLRILEAGEGTDSWLDVPAARLAARLLPPDDPPAPARIGPYRIVREIGRGGMGIVYLAERDDGEFEQRVALKLVQRGLHLDARVVRRFREERQILAGLAHPGIARLLDGGLTDDGLPYFAMEHVDGESITRYCAGRGLGTEDRLQLFARVCDALAYAHDRGIVHRDVKPSNILVTESGHPRLLDFGIAKLVGADGRHATTVTRRSERLLTPEYASPEQIRGEPVTPATDVYCLGVLLYELLTGHRPFRRAERTAHELERAVLEDDPTRPSDAAEPELLRRRLKGDLDSIVLTAMRKEPGDRYRSAEALAADVRRHLAGQPVIARGDSTSYRLRRWVRRHRVLAVTATAAAAVAVATTAAALTVLIGNPAADRLIAGATRRVAFDPELELDPALSPDGSLVAFVAGTGSTMRLHVKRLGDARATPLATEVPGFHRMPRWSPDGRRIAFQAGLRIYEVDADGGPARLLVAPDDSAEYAIFPAWSPDGRTLAYVEDGEVYLRPVAGGPARRLASAPLGANSLAWSADGRRIAVAVGNSAFVLGAYPWASTLNLGNAAPSTIWILPIDGEPAIRVTDDRSLNVSPTWTPDGRALLYVSDRDGERDVYRIRLGLNGAPEGEPERVTTGLGAHGISLSADGTRLAYSRFRTVANIWAVTAPPAGAVEAVATPVTRGTQSIEGLALSADGRWLAFDSDRGGGHGIYRVSTDSGGGAPEQLTRGSANAFMPHWSPDGREIAFHTFAADGTRRIEIAPADGGPSVPVASRPINQRFPSWSPDGRSLLFDSDNNQVGAELYVVSRLTDGRWSEARRLTWSGGAAGRWSPDGREIVFTRPDGIWITDTAGRSARQVLRTEPGAGYALGNAAWSPDGREILFKRIDGDGRFEFWAVPAAGGAARLRVRPSDPELRSHRPELATDGRRFYFTVSELLSDVWTMELSGGR